MQDQAEFFEENWNRNIEGLVKIYSFTRCKAKSGIMKPRPKQSSGYQC